MVVDQAEGYSASGVYILLLLLLGASLKLKPYEHDVRVHYVSRRPRSASLWLATPPLFMHVTIQMALLTWCMSLFSCAYMMQVQYLMVLTCLYFHRQHQQQVQGNMHVVQITASAATSKACHHEGLRSICHPRHGAECFAFQEHSGADAVYAEL